MIVPKRKMAIGRYFSAFEVVAMSTFHGAGAAIETRSKECFLGQQSLSTIMNKFMLH